jgi:hypothetical protein
VATGALPAGIAGAASPKTQTGSIADNRQDRMDLFTRSILRFLSMELLPHPLAIVTDTAFILDLASCAR